VKTLRPSRILLHVLVVVVCLWWFTPLAQLLITGVRTVPDAATSGWWTIVLHPLFTVDNFATAADLLKLERTLPSTLAMALPAVALTIVLSAFGAFALTHYRFRGRLFVHGLLVALLAVPPQVTFSPLLDLFSAIGVSGTLPALWIFQVSYTLPFGVYLVRGFMAGVPEELTEAARLDGASDVRIFLQIVTPLAGPVLASLGILQFMWSWNDLLAPLIFMGTSGSTSPITLELAGLVQSTSQNQTTSLAAGAILATLPPLVVIVVLQRYFVSGITAGAVK